MLELTNPEWWRNAAGLLTGFVVLPAALWCLLGWGIAALERRGIPAGAPPRHGAPGPAVFAVALASGAVGVGLLQALDHMLSYAVLARTDEQWVLIPIAALVAAGCLLAAQLGRSPVADACYTTAGGSAGVAAALLLGQDLSGRESIGLIAYILFFHMAAITAALVSTTAEN